MLGRSSLEGRYRGKRLNRKAKECKDAEIPRSHCAEEECTVNNRRGKSFTKSMHI